MRATGVLIAAAVLGIGITGSAKAIPFTVEAATGGNPVSGYANGSGVQFWWSDHGYLRLHWAS